jgi:hypothetical protein
MFDGESLVPDLVALDNSRKLCNLVPRLFAYAIVAALLQGVGVGRSPGAQAPGPVGTSAPSPPQTAPGGLPDQVIILNNAADIGEFWKKLKQPDLIIVKPGATAAPGTAVAAPTALAPRSYAASSVKIRGRVENDMANLQLDLEVEQLAPGPEWIPIRLNNQIIISANENESELELKSVGQAGWEVRLEGQRVHTLRITLKAPVKASPERKQLQLAIPVAPTTFLELDIPRPVEEVRLDTGESIGRIPLPAGTGSRVRGYLTPRSRLRLEWSDEGDAGTQPAPLLAAQGEIEIDADADAITTRSTWMIRCVRGVARKLEIRLDEQDIVPQLELDDQSLVAGIEHNVLTIPLSEPLRPGSSRRLVMQTRRTFPPSSPRTFSFVGFPLSGAGDQSGAISITQAANLWVDVRASRGLRRIDPRFLPSGLRQRPGTSMAFQFLEQPFALELGVESSPPLFRSEILARLSLDPDSAQNQTRIDIERVRGRLYEIDVAVPPDLQLVTVGPPDLVESTYLIGKEGSAPARGTAGSPAQAVRISLTNLGRDQKSFSLNLVGRQRIGPGDDVKLGLFTVPGGVSTRSLYQIFTVPDLSFEAASAKSSNVSTESSVFRVQRADQPAGSPLVRNLRAPVLTLMSDENPASLRGQLTRHPLSISHETRLSARVSSRRIEARQDTTLEIRFGSISSLIVQVPFPSTTGWEVQARQAVRREELGPVQGAPGLRRYRLSFDPPISDRSSIEFRYQLPLDRIAPGQREIQARVPWIGVEEGKSRSTSVDLASEPDILTAVNDSGWSRSEADDPAQAKDATHGRYRMIAGDGKAREFPFTARPLEQVAMPSLVASRALLRTTIGSGDESRTHAWYRIEDHTSQVSFRLPERAAWIRARIDGRPADLIEFDPAAMCYRLVLPADSRSRPVLLELEYQLSKAENQHLCQPPQLLEGAVAMETLWEIQAPWNLAVIGVPDGWADENQWYWDTYVWKRKPWGTHSRLVSWVAGSSTKTDGQDGLQEDDRVDTHSYLFARTGQPVTLELWVASRAWIAGSCSGLVLTLGLLLMFSRIRFRAIWAAAATLCLLGGILVHPSTVILIVQSSLGGIVLALAGLAIQRLIDRPRGIESNAAAAGTPSGSSDLVSPPGDQAGVGSDDSTAIRVRTPSTMDHVAAPLVVTGDPPSARKSSFESFG